MRKGYWIAHVEITNPERYKDYVAANAIAFKKYGARFLARGGTAEVPKVRECHQIAQITQIHEMGIHSQKLLI